MFEVLIHRATFIIFKEGAREFISSLPAQDEDEFATVMARDSIGTPGFASTPGSESVLDDLQQECYCLHASDNVVRHGTFPRGHRPDFFFKDKGGAFGTLVAEHERYIVAMKRYSVISRHRYAEKPEVPELSRFLEDDSRMERGLYDRLLSSCDYVGVTQRSKEHGDGAFDVMTRDMHGFLTKLKDLACTQGRLVFVEKRLDLPFW